MCVSVCPSVPPSHTTVIFSYQCSPGERPKMRQMSRICLNGRGDWG